MKRLLYLSLLALAAVLAGCNSSVRNAPQAASGGHTRVSIALDWTPNTNHTGVYVAQAEGWYAQQGLDVQILPYSEGGPEPLVAAGKADFGFSSEEGVTAGRAAGQPLVSVAAVIQRNSSAFVTLKSSGIDRPAQLQGKRYAGFGSPFEEPVIDAVIKCDGGSSGSVQNITTDVSGFEALQAGKADFVWVFLGWEVIAAQRQHLELNTFPPVDYCVPNYYTPVIVSSERYIRDHADVARRFMAATARGYEYAIANPAAAADLLIKTAPPGSFPDPGLVQDSAAYLAPLYKQGVTAWGTQDLKTWTDYPHFMVQSGRLKDGTGKVISTDLDYGKFFTNDLLPK
ncbi:MAG TPA: ABC transporter substrate-binding protein [Dehalococcoidia bacterium]|nr:ABC transporter substrate-binding protein [Dehalococcoidia bacterium]